MAAQLPPASPTGSLPSSAALMLSAAALVLCSSVGRMPAGAGGSGRASRLQTRGPRSGRARAGRGKPRRTPGGTEGWAAQPGTTPLAPPCLQAWAEPTSGLAQAPGSGTPGCTNCPRPTLPASPQLCQLRLRVAPLPQGMQDVNKPAVTLAVHLGGRQGAAGRCRRQAESWPLRALTGGRERSCPVPRAAQRLVGMAAPASDGAWRQHHALHGPCLLQLVHPYAQLLQQGRQAGVLVSAGTVPCWGERCGWGGQFDSTWRLGSRAPLPSWLAGRPASRPASGRPPDAHLPQRALKGESPVQERGAPPAGRPGRSDGTCLRR